MATKAQEEYRFRISCKVYSAQGSKEKAREFEFGYMTLTEARRNYKAILLGLYRRRKPTSFSICLNRYRDSRWKHAIYKEHC